MGIDITKAVSGNEPNVHIRLLSKQGVLYGFKIRNDSRKFEEYLKKNDINFEKTESVGSRYPYQFFLR